MPVFSFQSELLTPQMAATSVLRMVVGINGASLLVKNAGKALALKSWQLAGTDQGFPAFESDLRNVFGSERMLDWSFSSKYCALSSAAATLVPKRLFDPNHLAQYFTLLLRKSGERQFGFEHLEAFDCYLVWAADAGLHRLCAQYFPADTMRHVAAPLLTATQKLAPAEGYAVFANLLGQKAQVSVFERQNLVFFNCFDFTKPSDLLYYVLLAYKQFDLNPLDIPLTLSGTLLEDSDIFRLLLRYVRPMRFPPLASGVELPEAAQTLPAHYWFDLSTL